MVTLWIQRVAGWDGILPAVVWGLSALFAVIFPRNWGLVQFLAVMLPIAAFFIRMGFGWQAIRSNGCGPIVRGVQSVVFGFGILVLLLVDAFVILSHDLPRGALNAVDWIITGILFAIYLSAMIVAMHPGR